MAESALCIVGWHFHEHVLATLATIPDADVYVVSHQSAARIPAYVYDYIAPERVLVRPNIGYDWGGYQQFLDTGLWQNYEYIFFMHDDLEIRDTGFIAASIALLNNGPACFVGHGRYSPGADWPSIKPQAYAHARWKPPPHFEHDSIRGSFCATTRATLAALGSFEVFWDWRNLTEGFGNWSLLATCAKITQHFGPGCIAFLDEQYLHSAYLVELVRGSPTDIRPAAMDPHIQARVSWITGVCQQRMHDHWQPPSRPVPWLKSLLRRAIVAFYEGKGPYTRLKVTR